MPLPYPIITLKPGKDQSLKRFHPWVFSGAIAHIPEDLEEGAIVAVHNPRGTFLGVGHYQIGSIRVRICTFEEEELTEELWRKKLARSIEVRQQTGLSGREDHNMYRLIHGEGDGFPGLIVDLYGSVAVMQCHSIGFYHIRELLARLIQEMVGVEAVYDKSEHALPFKAPINPKDGFLIGENKEWKSLENGNQYRIDVVGGQKTGFFIDQRENRSLLGKYAEGREVLNTFCYTGGFSVAAMRGGAKSVVSVDSSQPAMALTDENIAMNFPADTRHTSEVADVFDYLKHIYRKFDLIVLDPPAFGKHRKVLDKALKGYRSINQRAFEQIRPGGILFTFSCSQVVSKDDFRRSVFTAAAIARRRVRILHQLSQPADHPISIYHPEGEYLKGLVLAVD